MSHFGSRFLTPPFGRFRFSDGASVIVFGLPYYHPGRPYYCPGRRITVIGQRGVVEFDLHQDYQARGQPNVAQANLTSPATMAQFYRQRALLGT